jgi:hypothetical protein
MPATLPEREFGSGVDHEQVAALVAAGWEVVRPSKVPGLDHELVVRRDGLDVAVRVPAWPDSRGVVAWQPFAGVEGAEALAREVHVLQQALSSGGRGWTLGTGALSTFRGAAAAHARVKQGGRSVAVEFERCETAPEDLVVPDLPNWWLAPAEWPDGGYAVLVDRHRDFLAALGSVLVPTGQLEPVEEGGLLVRAVVEGGSVPFVPSGEGWYPATLTALAEVDPEAFGRVEVLERLGTTGPVVRFFRGLTDALRAGLPAMPTGSPAYLALKGVYSTGISALGSAEYAKGTNAKWYRPDWKALHAGLHVANIWRSLVKARQAGAVLLGTGGRDGAVLWVPGRDDPVPGLKIGEGTGDWHVTATGRAGMVRRMVEGGAGIDAIKKELR